MADRKHAWLMLVGGFLFPVLGIPAVLHFPKLWLGVEYDGTKWIWFLGIPCLALAAPAIYSLVQWRFPGRVLCALVGSSFLTAMGFVVGILAALFLGYAAAMMGIRGYDLM